MDKTKDIDLNTLAPPPFTARCPAELNLQTINNCPICKGSKLRAIGKTATIHPDSKVQVDLVECVSCAHWFISPTLTQDELTRLYRNSSRYVVSEGGQPVKERFSIPEKYIIRAESANPEKPKKYLEVGIGRGLLFNHFKSLGYDCFGVEPGPWAKTLPNVVKDVARLDQKDFDVIVIADVLEHLEDPLSFIKNIGDLIETGTIYACFPNNQSLLARLSKEKWRMVKPFGHLHLFSKRSLLIAFESNGFKVKEMTKTNLIECCRKDLAEPAYLFPAKLFLYLVQRFWGDQWIVQLEK